MLVAAGDVTSASPAVSSWLEIALAVIGTGVFTTFLNIVFGRKKNTAEVESIAQKTTGEAVDLLRRNTVQVMDSMKEQINRQDRQIKDLVARVESAEEKAEKAEARVDLAERRIGVMGRAIAEWKARVDQLEAILRRNGIEIPPWTAPPDDLVLAHELEPR